MSRTEVRLSHVVVVENQPTQFVQLSEAQVAEPRSLNLVIGRTEAEEISRRLQGDLTPRPLTHALLESVIREFGGELIEVEIADLAAGTYFATLRFRQNGEIHEIDGRPSDGIALAVVAGAKIFVADKVWDALIEDSPDNN
jgi:uncharacterized protein